MQQFACEQRNLSSKCVGVMTCVMNTKVARNCLRSCLLLVQQRSRGQISCYTPAPRKMAVLHQLPLTDLSLIGLHRRKLWLMGLSQVNLRQRTFPSKQVTKDIIHLHLPSPLQPSKPVWSVQISSFLEQEGISECSRPLYCRGLVSVEGLT